jgi:DNA polymerase I-like protein with 3'-5' exonuclease and polymerase domains
MGYAKFDYPVPPGFGADCSPFDVKILVDDDWSSSSNRVMFLIQHVDSGDLKNKKMLSSSPGAETFNAIVNLAETELRRSKLQVPRYSSAVVNFNYFRNYHLRSDNDQYDASQKAAVARAEKIINKLKPTAIVIVGDEAMSYMCPQITNSQYKRGWVHDYTFGSHKCKVTSTIGYDRTYVVRMDDEEDDDLQETASENDQYETAVANANLVSLISRHIACALHGKLIFDGGPLTPSYKVIDTIEKFDKLMDMLSEVNDFACDTETTGLDNYAVKILTIQFAVSEKLAYILPYMHKDTPFVASELKYIRKRLKRLFSLRKRNGAPINMHQYSPTGGEKIPHILGQNFGYDLRILRQELGLPVVHWLTWDVTAGEFCLDENLKMVAMYGTKPYELHHILARYGCDWYFRASFGKADRVTIKDVPLSHEVYEYCAMDVQCLYYIRKQQVRRAATLDFDGEPYTYRYCTFVLGTMSCLVKVMSMMEHRGAQLDMAEFMRLLDERGPIRTRIGQATAELYKLDTVKKANALIAKTDNIPTKGMFGAVQKWVFDVGTVAHKKLLFFDVMKLTPLREGKQGPSMDKFFQKAYKDSHPEVALLSELQRLNTIYNTFIVGWYKRLSEDPDGSVDGRLRPRYGYTPVVTGRSNSFSPNLQNVPQHSAEAKYVKRLFVAPFGYLKVDADYSAHEVRGWGLAARDPAVAAAFQMCLDLIYAFRRSNSLDDFMRMVLEADIHKVNYSLYTGTPTHEVTDEQRQDSKGIVFGSIYGMSMRSLAKQIKKALEETEKISRKFFSKFKKAKAWLDWAVEHTRKKLYVFSPLGRRRNLAGYVVPVPALQGAFERRGRNSPIQGMGSDMGYIAGEIFAEAMYQYCKDFNVVPNDVYVESLGGEPTAFDRNPAFSPSGIDSMVHDSLKTQPRYDLTLVSMHIQEWAMTGGVRDYVKQWYNFDLNVDLAIEFEIGASADSMETWQWSNKTFSYEIEKGGKKVTKTCLSRRDIVYAALEKQRTEFGYDIDSEALIKQMAKVYKESLPYLNEHFPLPFTEWCNK